MKNLLLKIMNHQALNYTEAKEVIYAINNEAFNDYQLVAIMTGLQMKGIELDELKGFQDALLETAIQVDLNKYNGIDLCGTGGDGKNTFNISTCTSMVLASMGYKVIKHGNYGVSSISGSSNVLENIGFKFPKTQDELEKAIEQTNIAVLHAPYFHPTLKKVSHLRKELGIRTFFNSLGPLVNPAKPSFQMTGTFSLELAKIYSFLLRDIRTNFKVTYGLDGYDELTLVCPTKIYGKHEEKIYTSGNFGINNSPIVARDLHGGETVRDAAEIFVSILKGEGTEAQNKVIAANVACAIQTINPSSDLKDNFLVAEEQLISKRAFKHLKKNLI